MRPYVEGRCVVAERPCVEGRRVVAERPYVEGRHVVAEWLYVEGRHVTALWRSVRQQLERPRQESVQDQHHFAPLTFKVMTSFSTIFQCRCRCSRCCHAHAAMSAVAGHAAASEGDVTRGARKEDAATGTSPLLRRSLFFLNGSPTIQNSPPNQIVGTPSFG